MTTISAKRVRRALLELDSTLTPEFLKENKEDVDKIIGVVFEEIQEQATGGCEEVREESENAVRDSRKRKQEEEPPTEEWRQKQEEKDDSPPTKKAKKAVKNGNELSGDAELARQLSSQINARSTRGAGKSRALNGTPKKGARQKKKSAAMVYSDDESDEEGSQKTKKPRKKPAGEKKEGGTAKGGFAKEYALRYHIEDFSFLCRH